MTGPAGTRRTWRRFEHHYLLLIAKRSGKWAGQIYRARVKFVSREDRPAANAELFVYSGKMLICRTPVVSKATRNMATLSKLGPGPQLGYIVVFSASHWTVLEQAYGQTLPDRARKLVGIATLLFTLTLPVEQSAPKVGGNTPDVLGDLEQLIRQAERLRAKLYPSHHWSEEYRAFDAPRPMDRRLGIELEAIGEPNNESDILRISLTGLIESGSKLIRHVRKHLKDKRNGSTESGPAVLPRGHVHLIQEGEAWDAWIVWITLIVRAFNLPFGIRESDVYRENDVSPGDRKPARFVELIKALQTIACPRYQRSTTDGGLAKAVARARRVIILPKNVFIGVSVVTDELERELLNIFDISAYSQLNARDLSPVQEAVRIVIDGARPGIHPFIPLLRVPK